MDFDDIIKILVALLFILPGLFGGKKKKPTQRNYPKPEQMEPQEDPFKDLKDILSKQQTSTTHEVETDDENYEVDEENYDAQQQRELETPDELGVAPEDEGKSVFAVSKDKVDEALARFDNMNSSEGDISQGEIRGVEDEVEETATLFDDFDAQKAVVYSEILAPKYK